MQFELSATERRAAFSLASLFLIRMLGLFMILPVFALYAEHLPGSSATLMGLAVGIYGLTQAIFQIPFGLASDRVGRKPMIYLGLVIFGAGSVVAATASTMEMIIAGRALQGSGAIAATVMALAADLTRDDVRMRVMGIIGMSIGLSFSLSVVVGPLLNSWIGVPGIFWTTAVLSVVGIGIVKFLVPDPVDSRRRRDTQAVPAHFKNVLKDKRLLYLNFSIFILHMILTSIFVVLAFLLRDSTGVEPDRHWMVYGVVIVLAMIVTVPIIIYAERKRKLKQVFASAVGLLAISLAVLMTAQYTLVFAMFALWLFFVAFNVLEASLPSMVARTAPADQKGTAMGVYSSCQFLGAFVGGASGGILYKEWGLTGVLIFGTVATVLWWILALCAENPNHLSNFTVTLKGQLTPEQGAMLAQRLGAVPGVAEAMVVSEEGVAYLKVDHRTLDRDALNQAASMPA